MTLAVSKKKTKRKVAMIKVSDRTAFFLCSHFTLHNLGGPGGGKPPGVRRPAGNPPGLLRILFDLYALGFYHCRSCSLLLRGGWGAAAHLLQKQRGGRADPSHVPVVIDAHLVAAPCSHDGIHGEQLVEPDVHNSH